MAWAVWRVTGLLKPTMPSEGGNRIPSVSPGVRFNLVFVDRQAAGIGVLYDGDGRVLEAGDGVPGCIGVQDVVEGELLAMELFCSGDAAPFQADGVEGALLVEGFRSTAGRRFWRGPPATPGETPRRRSGIGRRRRRRRRRA